MFEVMSAGADVPRGHLRSWHILPQCESYSTEYQESTSRTGQRATLQSVQARRPGGRRQCDSLMGQ